MSNDQALRLGIAARSSFNATLSIDAALSAAWQAHPTVTLTLGYGHLLELTIQSGGTPFSTLYGVVGHFSSRSDVLKIIGGASLTHLIKTNDLEVSGFGIEVTTPGDIGGSTEFQYASGKLVKVIYGDGSTKDLTYTSGRLTETVETSTTRTVTKTLNYNLSGTLIGITQVEA